MALFRLGGLLQSKPEVASENCLCYYNVKQQYQNLADFHQSVDTKSRAKRVP